MLTDDSDGKGNHVPHDHHDHEGKSPHHSKRDMIAATTCVWFKTLINLDLVPDPSCVTLDDMNSAMNAVGFGRALQGLTLSIFIPALAKQPDVECLDFTATEGQVELEHSISTGMTEPIFNKDRFEEIFQGEGKKHNHNAMVAMTNITDKTLNDWQDDQNEREVDGLDQKGLTVINPYPLYGIIFDLFGEDADPPATFGKIMRYDDMKKLVEWGEAPNNACATTLDHGTCANVPHPDLGPGTDSVMYAMGAAARGR